MKRNNILYKLISIIFAIVIYLLQVEVYGITPDEIIKLKEAGVSEETIQKLIEADKGMAEKEQKTCTVVLVEVKFNTLIDRRKHTQAKVYKKWDAEFARLDGMSFPREYNGKLFHMVCTYKRIRRYKGNGWGPYDVNYNLTGDIFVFELDPGMHTFLFPNELGNYQVEHIAEETRKYDYQTGHWIKSESFKTYSTNNYVFSLEPGGIRYYKYELEKITEVSSLNKIFDDILAREKIEEIYGVNILSKITEDHKDGKRGYNIISDLKEIDKSNLIIFSIGYDIRWWIHLKTPENIMTTDGSPYTYKGSSQFESEKISLELEVGEYFMQIYDSWAPKEYNQFIKDNDGRLWFSILPGRKTIISFEKDQPIVKYE